MSASSDINGRVRNFLLTAFLEGEDPSQLEDTTPLVSSGILDSIATLKLVSFLEGEFGITIAAHEADADHLNTVAQIVSLVSGKLRG
jgi:acyl carrier protein